MPGLLIALAILAILVPSLLTILNTLLKTPVEQVKTLAVSWDVSRAAEWITKDANKAARFIEGSGNILATFIYIDENGNPVQVVYRWVDEDGDDIGELVREEGGESLVVATGISRENLGSSYDETTNQVRVTLRAKQDAGGREIAKDVEIYAQLKTKTAGEAVYGPKANFTAEDDFGDPTDLEGLAPLTVNFTDTSEPGTSGIIDTWQWRFGDGTTSNEQNPSHAYEEPGLYTVSLFVSGPDGWDITIRNLAVTVFGAEFGAEYVPGNPPPLEVHFFDRSVGNVTGWSWNFGDGGTSDEQNPVHVYTSPGLYTVSLTVTGDFGTDTELKEDFIIVGPKADFSGTPTSGPVPLTVQFNDESSGSIDTRTWNFGDGATSDETNPTHTYTSSGVYTVSLSVAGPYGSDVETKENYITVGPRADFEASPIQGWRSTEVQFTDTSEGAVSSWEWDFDNDGVTDSTEQNPTHTYDEIGAYSVSLKVSGPYGEDTELKPNLIHIYDEPEANFSADPTQGWEPLTVQFHDESTGWVDSWEWDFDNDGTVDSTLQNPTYTYHDPGVYSVRLKVSGTLNGVTKEDTLVRTDYIQVGLDADFHAEPAQGWSPLDVQFYDDSTGSYDSWEWDFGDGGTSTEPNPSHTYTCGSAGWWNSSWSRRQAMTISNSGGMLVDYQVRVVVNYDADMQPDFDDVRFVDSDNLTELSYWRESYTTGSSATFWVKVPNIPSGGKTIYMYYGNPTAASASDPDSTFIVFLNFTRDGVASYGGGQDKDSSQWEVIDDTTLHMWGNNWKACLRDLSVAGDGSQAISFEFKSVGEQGEINGVGLDTNNSLSSSWFYRIYGTQNWGRNDHYGYSGGGNWQSYTLVLNDFGGNFNRFVFCNDADSGQATDVYYRDVRVRRYTSPEPSVSFGPEEEIGSSGAEYITYTVSLTVTGPLGSKTETKEDYIKVYVPPVADFHADVTEGLEPLTVHFYDDSSGYHTSWEWDFDGDGVADSTVPNPTYVYAEPGVYTVSLKVSGTVDGDTRSDEIVKTDYILVGLKADFTADPRSGPEPLTVQFTDSSMPVGGITSWLWDFGDGTESSEQNPTHTYTCQAGEEASYYTVSLTITAVIGEETKTDTVTKENYIAVYKPPQADFHADPTEGWEPLDVQFYDDSTGYYESWQWDFGDGETSTEPNPSHTYNYGGTTAWWNSSWSRRQAVTISNSGGMLVDYQVRVVVNYDADMQPDFDDVRFVDSDNLTELSYWRESYTTGSSATFWVKVPNIPSGGKTIYMYYGNPTAASASDPDSTFIVFLNFTRDGVASYGGGQDKDSSQWEVIDDTTLHMWGNNWKACLRDLSVAGDGSQAISFEFKSVGEQGEINGVGLDTNNSLSSSWFYRIYGTQNWGRNDHYGYSGGGNWQSYTLVLNDFGGNFNRFVFCNDADSGQATDVYYKDVRVRRYTSPEPSVSFGPEEEAPPAPGVATYSPSLTISGPGGEDTASKDDYITVYGLPDANFQAQPTQGWEPLEVQFSDQSDGYYDSWSWDFGDGGSSTEPNPAHTYSSAGNYLVILTVSGTVNGVTKSDSQGGFVYVYAAPDADFHAQPRVGLEPLTVHFFDDSTGYVDSWEWDFDNDGVVDSTEPNPVYTYTEPGVYTVRLRVSGTLNGVTKSDWEIKTDYIVVGLKAEFESTPREGWPPLTVQFTDLSIGEITSWSWDFGDGGTSTEQNPSHTYGAPGVYTVSLTVSGPLGSDTETKVGYITVYPVADFTASPTSGYAPLEVHFTDQSIPAGQIDSWSWDFGDGGTSTEQNPVHTYTSPGTYTVSLTVTASGWSDSLTRTAYIHVWQPYADFYAVPTSGVAPLEVQFIDNSAGPIENWSWDFNGDGVEDATGEGPHLYTYNTPGTYTVSLTVSGPGWSDTETKPDYITVYAPAQAGFSANPTSGYRPLEVEFTDESTGDITSWSWDFGDGSPAVQWTQSTRPADGKVSHTYTSSGTYDVVLTVSGPGGTDTETKTITVLEPAVDFSADPTEGNAPLTVQFTDLSTGEIDAWHWDFGDGGISFDQSPTHTYNQTGLYTVSLTVTGPWGSATETKENYIKVVPIAEFTANPLSGYPQLTVHFYDQSIGDITSWQWDFGDPDSGAENTSTEQNPVHTYTKPGQYTVTLTVTEPSGASDTETKTDYILVLQPAANFSGNPTSGSAPLEVQFTDQSTGTITTWSWNFGDGQTSSAQNPVHTYDDPGTYTVSLTVTGPWGSDSEVKENYITVYTPAQADFQGSPTEGWAPLEVQFTDKSTGDFDSWAWDFENDGVVDSTEQDPTHTYNDPGLYSVALTVSGPGGSDTEVKDGYIRAYEVPEANFSAGPTSGVSPLEVQFTDESTGYHTAWEWDFDDDGVTDSTQQNPVHTFTCRTGEDISSYTVSLTVTGTVNGDSRSSTETKVDYITVYRPLVAEFSGTPTIGFAPLEVQFTDLSSGAISSWTWNFGDGTTSSEQNPSHTYTEPGKYSVALTITGLAGSDVENKINYITVLRPGEPELDSLSIMPENAWIQTGQTLPYTAIGRYPLTGTLTFTNGSTEVTGVGTAFTTELEVNDYVMLEADGVWAQVSSIESDTHLTLTSPYSADGGSGPGKKGRDLTKSVWWSSSNEGVATIESGEPDGGVATGVGAGTTTITASSTTASGKDVVSNPAMLSVGTIRIWVVDADGTVYRYNTEGLFLDSWELVAENSQPEGITTDGTSMWIVDQGNAKVYKYHMWGGLEATWDLYLENSEPEGIVTDGASLWVVDQGTKKVYQYTLGGTYQSSWALDPANALPEDIATNGTYIWVVDDGGKVHKYDRDGHWLGFWTLAPENTKPDGIVTNGKNFWVVDKQTDRVYMYTMQGELVSSWALNEDNTEPRGITSNSSS